MSQGFLTMIWIAAAVLLTFVDGPCEDPGNGYFGTWAAVCSAASLTFLETSHSSHSKVPDS